MKKLISIISIAALCSLPCNSQYKQHVTGMTVYVTPNGAKYHKKDCSTLSRSKKINALDIDTAKSKGYTACKICF